MFDCRNMRNTETECVDKNQCYFRYTRYQAARIKRVTATVIYNGLIQLPSSYQA